MPATVRVPLCGTITTAILVFALVSGAVRADTLGAHPCGDMVLTGSQLYGVTREGGAFGGGTVYVFDLIPRHADAATGRVPETERDLDSPVCEPALRTLHNFTGGTDGATPVGGLVLGPCGDLYGTASAGGAYNRGTIFRISPRGKFTILHSFTGGDDGASPLSGLLHEGAELFGTTSTGGRCSGGTVFSINSSAVLRTLCSFDPRDCSGTRPVAGLVKAGDNMLYGVTTEFGPNGAGSVYSVNPGQIIQEKPRFVAPFCSQPGQPASPVCALSASSGGTLLGVSPQGGSCNSGIVFKVCISAPPATIDSTYTFTGVGQSGGARPSSPLITPITCVPAIYFGCTSQGGRWDRGTVYVYESGGSCPQVHNIYEFADAQGAFPCSKLAYYCCDGSVIGTTVGGGEHGNGTIFKLTPIDRSKPGSTGYTPSRLFSF